MKFDECLKEIGKQLSMALNEDDPELRSEHKYNMLEQIEALMELSKAKDHMILTTAAYIDQATKGEAGELTSELRKFVF